MKSTVTETTNLVEKKILTFEDLLPGEFGEIIGFKYQNYGVDHHFGTIIYNTGNGCIILKPAIKSDWKINAPVENDLYYIKKIVLINDCFYDEDEVKEKMSKKDEKKFKPFTLNITVESEEDLAVLWCMFNNTNNEIDYKIGNWLPNCPIRINNTMDFENWKIIDRKVKEMTNWKS